MILHIQYVTVITISALLALNLPDPAEPSAELSADSGAQNVKNGTQRAGCASSFSAVSMSTDHSSRAKAGFVATTRDHMQSKTDMNRYNNS
jgi:hypothetical protein